MSKYQVGTDISTLYDLEADGIKFYDGGKPNDLIEILKRYGVNSVRIRLWVDPFGENGESYGAGTCDLPRVLVLAKRVKAAGMSFMLDFHYSDFWADPSKQFIPKAWQNLDMAGLCGRIKDYSRDTVLRLIESGCEPDLIQVGNEITNGMLWDMGKLTQSDCEAERSGYDNLCALLSSAILGLREVTKAKLILHLERSFDNAVYREFFDNMRSHGVDYDAIGLSYYPYWHHGFDELTANMNDLWQRYRKELYVVETSYAFTAEHFNKSGEGQHLVVDEKFTENEWQSLPYPLTKEGQSEFCRELLRILPTVKGFSGVYYWEPAWIPTPMGENSPAGTWASEAARRYIHEEDKRGGNEWANQCLFDYGGNVLPALAEFKKFAERT